MSKIKLLDKSTISKIAAGEVIERPSSIVKELVENSIDAGSNNIIIEIENGGKSYIRVTDDGEGMNREDVELAFKRHSTSKLKTIEDIYKVMSLGFRGEALASVSSVSKVEVLTKTKSSDVGLQALISDGNIKETNDIGCPKGTTIIVRDIFYNLPVRQKFLKSINVESNYISDIVNKLAIGNPQVLFKFIKDGNVILKTPLNDNLSNTIYSVLGKEYYNNLISIGYTDDDLNIKGFISNNKLYRANRSHQYLYINGRYIWDLNISKVIQKQYYSLIPLNRFPVFILNIEINPNDVDINIHPTKQEVKFVNPQYVYDIIAKVIKETLMPSAMIPKFKTFKEKEKKTNDLPNLFIDSQKQVGEKDYKSNNDKNIIVKDLTQEIYIEDLKADDEFKKTIKNNDIRKNKNKVFINDIYKKDSFVEQKVQGILLDIKPIGRVFNTYIIAESKSDEKLYFIDQHAAHERIMFEKYMKEFKEEEIVTQQLISPEVIDITNTEMNLIEENIDLFEKLGFLLDNFGTNSIALRGVPILFGEPKVKSLFLDILDGLADDIASSYDTKIEKIMKISCTNAIKSGDKIDDLEILALFEDLKKCENPYTCPHGRPTIINLSKKDIEKEFLRIV